MRELLDLPTQRRLKIIEQLNEMSDWISSNELAQKNNASLRTINNDVSYLKDNWYPHLLIETSKKNGVRLKTLPSSHIRLVYSHVLKNSDAFRLLDAIFFDTTKSIEKWGETLFISESSLYRIINDLSTSLNHFDLTLEKKPCRIVGQSELTVRFFFTSFFREAYSITDWPFPTNREKIITFALSILDTLNLSCDENQVMKLANLINISLIRIKQGFYNDSHTYNSELTEQYANVLLKNKIPLEEIVNDLELTCDENLLNDLIHSIFYYRHNWTSDSEKVTVIKAIRHLIKTLRDIFDLTLSNLVADQIEDYLKYLYLYHKLYPYRNFIIFDHYYHAGTTIKENLPFFDDVVAKLLLRMERETHFPWYSHYRYVVLYGLMIKWENLSELLEEKKLKAKVLVMSDLGKDHRDFLIKTIQKNFYNKVTLYGYDDLVIFLNQTSIDQFNDYDLIITNFNTILLPVNKLLVIDDVPSNQDWANIRHAVNKFFTLSPRMTADIQIFEEDQ